MIKFTLLCRQYLSFAFTIAGAETFISFRMLLREVVAIVFLKNYFFTGKNRQVIT